MDITLQWMTVGMFLFLGAITQPGVAVERYFGQVENGDHICQPYETCGTIYRFRKTRDGVVSYHEGHITTCTCSGTPCTVNATESAYINGLYQTRSIQEVVCQPLNEMRNCEVGEIARAQIHKLDDSLHFEIYCKCEGHFRSRFGFGDATEPAYPTTDEMREYPYPNLPHAVEVYRCAL